MAIIGPLKVQQNGSNWEISVEMMHYLQSKFESFSIDDVNGNLSESKVSEEADSGEGFFFHYTF